MTTYTYKAKTNAGPLITGSIQAHNLTSAIASLKNKGLYIINIDQPGFLKSALTRNFLTAPRISIKDKTIFTRQLSILLKAGVKLTNALKTLQKQTQNKHLCSVIEQLAQDIEQSSSLSQAMEKHPKVFSTIYTSVIKAAEKTGATSQTLSTLSERLSTQQQINSKVRAALAYPAFLLAVSIIIVAVLVTFVIPNFTELFANAGQKLPTPTKILIQITDTIKFAWPFFLLFIALSFSAMTIAMKNPQFKLFVDTILLKLPLFGPLNKKIQLTRFTQTLGTLLNGGVKILPAVATAKETSTNSAFKRDVADIQNQIIKGSTLTQAISKQKHFNRIVADMVAVGEETATLDDMLTEVSNMYQQQTQTAIDSLTTLIGPLMIAIMGLITGFVVMAILLPIFETSTMIN